MYGIYIYIWFAIYHQYTPVLLAYIPYMDPMGIPEFPRLRGIHSRGTDEQWQFPARQIYFKQVPIV